MAISWKRGMLFGLFALLLVASTRVRAADAPAPPQVDPQAQKVLDDYGKYVLGLKGFSVKVTCTMNIEQQGQKQEINFLQRFQAQRPNKLVYTLESPQGGASVTSNGKEITLFLKQLEKYGVEEAPDSWAALVVNPMVVGLMAPGNSVELTSSFFADEPGKKLVSHVKTVKYAGKEKVDGVECHILEAEGEQQDWRLWITAGDKPLPRKFVPDLTKTFERLAKQAKGESPFVGMKVSNTVALDNWEVNPKFDADTFTFKAPSGAEQVDSLMEALTGQGPAPPSPLLGKAAPEVKLDLLEGGTLDLAALKNKKIVILDFWATWCGPCKQAMPIIEKVVEKFKDKGVALYAVNLEEKPEDIREFLETTELKIAVALDSNGAVGREFKAEAIPQTVLIGKDGTVQVVRVGLSANLDEELAKDIEALLAGKNLAAETLAKAEEKTKAREKRQEAAKNARDSEDKGQGGDSPKKENGAKAPEKKAAGKK